MEGPNDPSILLPTDSESDQGSLPEFSKRDEPRFTGLAVVKVMPFLSNSSTAFKKSCHSIGTRKKGRLNVAVINLLIPLVKGG